MRPGIYMYSNVTAPSTVENSWLDLQLWREPSDAVRHCYARRLLRRHGRESTAGDVAALTVTGSSFYRYSASIGRLQRRLTPPWENSGDVLAGSYDGTG
jgi:hypothetical protein